jgi:hypothetical protein
MENVASTESDAKYPVRSIQDIHPSLEAGGPGVRLRGLWDDADCGVNNGDIEEQCRAFVNSLVSILPTRYHLLMPRDARQTRRTILDAAYREFRRKGFVRVNVDEIAAASRVTKRTLYSHFRSKDDLLAAAFQLQIELASEAKQHLAREAVGSTAEQIVESWFAVLRQGPVSRGGPAPASRA